VKDTTHGDAQTRSSAAIRDNLQLISHIA
jgi:hypothetical protein